MEIIVKTPDRATAYAEKVCAGDVVCGKPHRQACERHLRDLSRQDTDVFPYIWDPERSEEILRYAETLTIIDGYEPKPVKLHGCQEFDLGVPMGWLNRDRYRRFRRKYKSVARQNGKTFENGITGSYIAAFDKYRLGKLFCVATSKKQARLAWNTIRKFILMDPDLAEFFEITDYKNLITALNTLCTIEALSKEAGLEDGEQSVYASVDEIHQHKDNSIYKAMYNGQRSLKEALTSMITTRGKDINSFCYDFDSMCLSVLDGGLTADDLFCDIYCLDDNDGYFDESCFIKSNPVLCATDWGMKTMLNDAATAKVMGGSELTDFIVKCQNGWVENTDIKFISASLLPPCRVDRELENFAGCSAFAGIDLSSGGDLTTLDLEFEEPDGGFYNWSISFIPRGRLNEHIKSDLAPYDLWEKQELIVVTGGASDFKNDYGFIISVLNFVIETYNIKLLGIGYDPHNADAFLSQLESFGVPLLEVKQSARFLNDATWEVQLLIKGGKYHWSRKNELFDWSVRNAKITENSFKERKIDKEPNARKKRIDPVDAAIDAHVARMKLTGKGPMDMDKVMDAYLAAMGWKGKGKNEQKK